jgi:hypothetical protein
MNKEAGDLSVVLPAYQEEENLRILLRFVDRREKVQFRVGYVRTFEAFSQWDNWYIKAALV